MAVAGVQGWHLVSGLARGTRSRPACSLNRLLLFATRTLLLVLLLTAWPWLASPASSSSQGGHARRAGA